MRRGFYRYFFAYLDARAHTVLKEVKIPQKRWAQAALDYDLSIKTKDVNILSVTLGKSTSPMIELAKEMRRDELRALLTQVKRLFIEEMTERDELDEYTIQVLSALKELR